MADNTRARPIGEITSYHAHVYYDPAMTRAEAVAMFEAARRNGVHLVEAFPYRAQPQTLKLRELIDAKAIGRIQTINSNFGVAFSDPANIRLNSDIGGGALVLLQSDGALRTGALRTGFELGHHSLVWLGNNVVWRRCVVTLSYSRVR